MVAGKNTSTVDGLSVFLGLLLSACTGIIGSAPNGAEGSGPGSGSSAHPGTPGNPSTPKDPFAACAGGVTPGPAPLARLTTLEYRNTLRDLFPKASLPVDDYTLPAEVSTEGFTNNAETQTPSAAVIEALANNAKAIGAVVEADPTGALSCTPTTPTEESDCGHQFVSDFGGRAFRGAFDASDESRYDAFFDASYASWGFPKAVSMVVEAMVQSPKFLYRIERGVAESATSVALTSQEIASRLSYFVLDTLPDQTLLDAVKNDTLTDPAVLETETRRLLADPKARAAVAEYTAQWFRFDKMDALSKAPDLFPSFTAATADSMRRATRMYVDHLFWDEGKTLASLLTDTRAYVDAELAPIYGVAAPSGTGLTLVDVGTERAGVLTQAGLLAGFSHERSDAPVLRGVFVLDRLLCATPKPPPKGVNTALPVLTAGSQQTTRQQLETSHVATQCAYCHDGIDGIGFSFEKFDAIGALRTTEFGLPVDDTGALHDTDVDGPVHGAVALGKALAGSGQVERCASTQALRYALGVTRTEIDPCSVKSIVSRFHDAGGDMTELLVAVATSDAFRYRTPE